MTDIGGAIAIKGFNFQKAIVCLIAVLNYNKEVFSIFVENQEDIEILFPDSHTFIQAKSTKGLSVKKLINSGKKKSILYKNLDKNKENVNNRYKIVVSDFIKTDKESLLKATDNCIFDKNVYVYSEEQKKIILSALVKEGAISKDIENKLKHSYLVYFPYSEGLDDAIRYIVGCMAEKDICVDNNAARIALNELALQIDKKSAFVSEDGNPYPCKKSITGEYLKTIFTTIDKERDIEQVIDELKTANILTIVEIKKIEKEMLKIMSVYKSLRKQIISIIGDFSANTNIVNLITNLYNKVCYMAPKETIYAILIDIVVEKIQDESQ